MRPSRSTSASSPRREAPSSIEARLRRVAAFSSASISTARPPSKRTRRPRMIVPSRSASGFVAVTWPSVRAGSGVVKTSSVGRFGMWRMPSTVETSVGQLRGVPLQRRHPLLPGRDGIVLVEPEHVLELLPELLVGRLLVEVGEDEPRPGARRARAAAPVRRPLADHLRELLLERQLVLARARRVEAVHRLRRDDPAERDPRGPLLAELLGPVRIPRGHEVERVLGGVRDPLALDERVEPGHVDELRAAPVGRAGHRPRQLLVPADVRREGHDLAGLDVGAELDEQARKAVDTVLGVHGRRCYRQREHGRVTTLAAIDRFLERPALSDATRRAYRSDLRQFAAWLERHGTRLEEVDVRVLADWVADLGRARATGRRLAPASMARKLTAVRG